MQPLSCTVFFQMQQQMASNVSHLYILSFCLSVFSLFILFTCLCFVYILYLCLNSCSSYCYHVFLCLCVLLLWWGICPASGERGWGSRRLLGRWRAVVCHWESHPDGKFHRASQSPHHPRNNSSSSSATSWNLHKRPDRPWPLPTSIPMDTATSTANRAHQPHL